jgi:hypothetical protein
MTEATKYRKKPVEIEGLILTDTNAADIVRWITEGGHRAIMRGGPGGGSIGATVTIRTLEGDHLASVGDVVIRGVQGEFYPVKPEIFAETYDKVDGPIEADTYDGYMGGFKKGDRVKHWNGRTIGTVLRIFKKSKRSLWYIDVDRLGKAGTVELKASDCQKVGA